MDLCGDDLEREYAVLRAGDSLPRGELTREIQILLESLFE